MESVVLLYIRDKQGDDTNRINEFADEISEIKEDIEEIKQTTSRERPRGKSVSPGQSYITQNGL
jgi:hypothetical protein